MKKKEFVTELPVFVKVKGKCHVINVNELVYMKAERQYTCLYFKDEESPIRLKASMNEVAKALPKGLMISVSRSYLVNINEVMSFDKDFVIVKTGKSVKCLPLTNPHFEIYFLDLLRDMPFANL